VKTLLNAFKALATHACDDVTRPHLSGICARDAHTLEATDGHRFLRVRLNAAHNLTPGRYPAKPSIARLRAGVMPEMIPDNGLQWPDTDQIIPARESAEHKAARIVALNFEYLADASNALVLAVGKYRNECKVQFPTNPLDPIRMDAKSDDAEAVAVIMPMRG